MTTRRPPLRAVGTDPDYRFTLANERTFLAWMRTALALVAGAVALGLVPNLGPQLARIALTVVLLVLATVVTIGAYVRWDRAERALRENRSLPIGLLPRLVVSGLVVVVIGVAVLVVLAESTPR